MGSLLLMTLLVGVPSTAVADGARPLPAASRPLPLGPAGLTETRTQRVVQPGVTLTTIVRGSTDAASFWTVEIGIPVGGTPDPDTPAKALSDRATAEILASAVRAAGFTPRLEEVTAPATADYDPGTLGWRVRVGKLASKAESDAVLADIVAAGFTGSSRLSGWDGSSTDRAPGGRRS